MRIESEDEVPMDLTEVEEEREQAERMFPENRYEIEEVDEE